MYKWFIRLCVAGTCAASVLTCTTTPNNLAGGSSDTEVSARISGFITDENGNPAAGASVRVRVKDYLPGQTASADSNNNRFDCLTDSNGTFVLDSVDDGDYVVEVLMNDSAGAITECRMFNAVSCTISTVVQPLGMVVGTIDASYENMYLPSRTKIEVLGTEHVVKPDSNRMFQIPLAAGSHQLRISVDSSYFDSITLDVRVDAAQPKFIGTIQLNYMPVPPCWDYTCDSMTVRAFLDSSGYTAIPVAQVTKSMNGRIVVLNLEGLQITRSLGPLGSLTALEVLNLAHTGTADSCRFLCGMWKLRVLKLNDNNLVYLSHMVEGLTLLLELDLTNNQLVTLPERVVGLTNLQKFRIDGNRMCNVPEIMSGWIEFYNPGWRITQACP